MTEKAGKNGRVDPLANVPGVVDIDRESAGVWYEHAPKKGGLKATHIVGFRDLLLDENGNGLRRVFVTSRYTPEYEEAQKRAQTSALRVSGTERQELLRDQQHRLDAKIALQDWDFTTPEGDAIPKSTDLALRLLTESQFRHHRAFIQVAIATLQGDIEATIEDDEGN